MRTGCSFCTENFGINDAKSEFYLSLDGRQMVVDVDIPIMYGGVTESGRFNIRYCPFCGRELNNDRRSIVGLQDVSRKE